MCTVVLNVNENLIRCLYPELNSPDKIRKWAQNELDKRIESLESLDTMDIEEARAMVHKTIRKEYAQ